MRTNQKAAIRGILRDRDVRFVLHFTQLANLDGIVRNGLLSRRDLLGQEHVAFASDHHRLDGNDDVVSVSISRVNEAMFAAKRRKSGHSHWAVLVLSAAILWERDCLFCWCNAARAEIVKHRGFRGGPWALSRMFDGTDAERRGLAPRFATDPEAEVQVLQGIEPSYICGAMVAQDDLADAVRTKFGRLPGPARQIIVQDF